MGRHQTFVVVLCMRWNVRIIETEGKMITIAGRPKKVQRWYEDFTLLNDRGAV